MNERIAVVTGAGTGIGRAVTIKLISVGWKVVLAGRRGEKLEETKALAGIPEAAACVPCDVTSEAEVEALFAQSLQTFGRVDMLFNNAGVMTAPATIDEIAVEQWFHALNVNLSGAYLCARAAFGIMKSQLPMGGRIINNGSISAQVPRPGSAPYAVTKHGITGLTRALALDGRAFNIACGQIDIGNARTDMATPMTSGIIQPNGSVVQEAVFDVRHVAEMVAHIAALPLDVNVPFVTLMATGMPLMGRG